MRNSRDLVGNLCKAEKENPIVVMTLQQPDERKACHDPGCIAGDHTNGIYVNGSTQLLMIWNNTISDSMGQTDAINLDAGAPDQLTCLRISPTAKVSSRCPYSVRAAGAA
jgi:hypothetical protein